MRAKLLSGVLLSVAVAGLLLGVLWLIHLRFQSGQAYPSGSSLRADPVGAKALFDSYDALGSLRIERNFIPFQEMEEFPTDTVLLLLNARGSDLYNLAQYESIRQFVSGGGRLVIALNPETTTYQYIEDESSNESPEEDSAEPEGPVDAEEPENESPFAKRANDNLTAFWGNLDLQSDSHEAGNAQLVATERAQGLPAALPWRKGGALDTPGEEWTPFYRINGEVVVAERMSGRGSIVLMTDYYLFSNEALLKHRHTGLLTWILEDARTVIFDETHLGVVERAGVATLMRRYRLEGVMLAFAIVCVLMVWRGISPLLPPRPDRSRGNVILAGHSTDEGLGDLVRRTTSAVDLPREAFQQWKQSFIRNAADEANHAKEIEAINALLAEYASQPEGKRRPLKLHLNIQTIINRKRKNSL